jgi:hypothetical protein
MELDRVPRRIVSRLPVWMLMAVPLLLVGCSKLVYSPAPVVPTKQSLPYSAALTLAQVETYIVRPGATMTPDPTLANHVTGVGDAVAARTDWEQALLGYLHARKTFVRVTTKDRADVDLIMHINIYMDPGLHFQFKQVYVARVDALVSDPHTHAMLLSYTGYGKAPLERREDNQEAINRAVQAGLNDLFGKMEQDSHMVRLGTGSR